VPGPNSFARCSTRFSAARVREPTDIPQGQTARRQRHSTRPERTPRPESLVRPEGQTVQIYAELMNASKGQTILRELLTELINGTMRENYRPDWLYGMELDFFFEQWSLAFEFQGDQHFAPVFGVRSHESQIWRDQRKRRICIERNIILVSVEANELTVKTMKRKIWRHLCMKRKTLAKSQKRKWMELVFKNKNLRGMRQEYRDKMKSYCQGLNDRFGQSPTTYQKGSRIRAKAVESIWQHAESTIFPPSLSKSNDHLQIPSVRLTY